MRLSLLPLVLCLAMPLAFGQKVGETVTTALQGQATNAKGAALRDQVNSLVALVREKKLAEAERAAADLRQRFEATFDPALRQYAFQSQDDFNAFKATSQERFEWIDWGYKECLQMQAFIAAERRNFPLALALLAAIEILAPVSAGTSTERGYILNQLSKPEEGLAAYRHALAVATRYPSQQPFRATALRGMGFSLIELHRLDEAESAFQESLKIDPGSQVALNELAYIRQVRAQSGTKP